MLKTNRIVTLFLSLAVVMSALGQDVSYNRAKEIALGFFKSHGIESETVVPQKARMKTPAKEGANCPYYIFNSADASAFIVVSGDSRTPQVLAYSTEGAFNEENIAPGANFMLEQYEEYINGLQSGTYIAKTKKNVDLGSGKLLETALWNQNPSPWWDYCPVVGGRETYAGCVATAMAIMMRHYEWPPNGFGSKSYTTETLELDLSANFEEFDYNWASLPKGNISDPGWNSANKAAVGKILYQCGIAANMDYDYRGGSGAGTNDQTVGLFRYFGYTLGDFVHLNNVDDDEWMTYIVDEINDNNPVFYQGENSRSEGHAFICDGYDADGKLHFNFGWSGMSNGFYEVYGVEFCNNQSICVGIHPDYNANNRILSDLHIRRSESGSNCGLIIKGDGLIHAGQTFSVEICNVYNVSDTDCSVKVVLFLCDSNGNRRAKLGEYSGLTMNKGGACNWMTFGCAMPYDYEFDSNDYVVVYSSLDGGTTWKEVSCSSPELGRIRMADVYDDTPFHMTMVSVQGKNSGLEVKEGSLVNTKGIGFYVTANCLQNSLSQSFTGEVAAFLCNSKGERKFKIGSSNISNLGSQYYYSTWNIGCVIPKGSDVEVGDKIMIFTKLSDEERWGAVKCYDPDKEYIEITADAFTATPTLLSLYNMTDGLKLYDGDDIIVGGRGFMLVCNNIRNELSTAFNGEIAIFLCDGENNPVYKLGSYSMELPGGYSVTLYIKCNITADMELKPGYRLCAFCRMADDDVWSFIGCDVPEKAYIELPSSLIPEQTPMGDVNNDGKISISDVVEICNLILKDVTDEDVLATADLDGSGRLTVADVVILVNFILSAE